MTDAIKLCKPQKNSHGWFVDVKGDVFHYLHIDGVVRYSISHHGKQFGYFATKAEALAAIKTYNAKQEAAK